MYDVTENTIRGTLHKLPSYSDNPIYRYNDSGGDWIMTCSEMKMVSSVAVLVAALHLHLGMGDIPSTVQHNTDTMRP